MERSSRRALSQIRDSIRHAFGIWGALPKSNGNPARQSRVNEATSSSGGIFAGRTPMLLTKQHERLSRCASSTLGVCCSLNACARSKQQAAANPGGAIANKPINSKAKSTNSRKKKRMQKG